jgi:hypothetical protein
VYNFAFWLDSGAPSKLVWFQETGEVNEIVEYVSEENTTFFYYDILGSTEMEIQVVVFWVVMTCSVMVGY